MEHGASYCTLSCLDKTRTNWRIKVRVIRMWATNSDDGIPNGFNLILLDDQNYDMHAHISTSIWDYMKNSLGSEKVYDIATFKVVDVAGNERPVQSPLCIMFTPETTVHEVPDINSSIPKMKFNLLQLQQIYEDYRHYVENATFANDIIGVLENMQSLIFDNQISGPEPMIKFWIGDGSKSFIVHLTGELAAYVFNIYQADLETPVILVLASMKVQVSEATGGIIFVNTPASKVYANPSLSMVYGMRHRLDRDGYVSVMHL